MLHFLEISDYDDMISLLKNINDYSADPNKNLHTKFTKVVMKTTKVLLFFIPLLTAGVSIVYEKNWGRN